MIRRSSQHKISIHQDYTARGSVIYLGEIEHLGLRQHKLMKDSDHSLLRRKIELQFERWDEAWEKQEARRKTNERKINSQNTAEELTIGAKDALRQVENILLHTLSVDDKINWNTLKDHSVFKKPNPMNELSATLQAIKGPIKPPYKPLPRKPDEYSFSPKFSFWDKIFTSSRQRKIIDADANYKSALRNWERTTTQLKYENQKIDSEYEILLKDTNDKKERIRTEFNLREKSWMKEKKDFEEEQASMNLKVDNLRQEYNSSDPEAITQYCEMVLNNSAYPDAFPQDFSLDYNPETKLLVIDYSLPAPGHLPTLTEVRFFTSKNELKEYHLSEVQASRMYDTAIYNITLRTIHEIFEADVINAIEYIAFNGWVEVVSKSTGKQVNSCIVSLQTSKGTFVDIDLAHVEPKACFKSLKGVGSSKLSGITPIQPLIKINKTDKRFVSSYDVTDSLDEGSNLASMGWEDFEHLLRELFEKEFSSNGGEVKVTQASRDGGVDAIAFDPDPIRGGKIVIQAKRYTNTVGVSAVRDLYGTVLNEGATKGILVTTADYGPDAYEFSKNKPITLLNGNNLLFLLEKHGHKARIDIVEARNLKQ
jgi:restriction system protein